MESTTEEPAVDEPANEEPLTEEIAEAPITEEPAGEEGAEAPLFEEENASPEEDISFDEGEEEIGQEAGDEETLEVEPEPAAEEEAEPAEAEAPAEEEAASEKEPTEETPSEEGGVEGAPEGEPLFEKEQGEGEAEQRVPDRGAQPAAAKPAETGAGDRDQNPETRRQAAIDLFRYLQNLANALPEDRRASFSKSDARLKMAYVIDKLEGRQGLLKEVSERAPQAEAKPVHPAGPPKSAEVERTLTYLGKLAGALPDRGLTDALERKLGNVIKGLKRGVTKDGSSGRPS